MGTNEKEIIIDDVNVAECEFLYDDDCLCKLGIEYGYDGETFGRFCKGNNNCYFKQLQRLKAENKNLKTENTKLKNKNQQMSGCITENEKYKQALKEIKEYCLEWYQSKTILEKTDEVLNNVN